MFDQLFLEVTWAFYRVPVGRGRPAEEGTWVDGGRRWHGP